MLLFICECDSAWQIRVEDFMKRDVKFVTTESTYRDVALVLSGNMYRYFPLVDNGGIIILCDYPVFNASMYQYFRLVDNRSIMAV